MRRGREREEKRSGGGKDRLKERAEKAGAVVVSPRPFSRQVVIVHAGTRSHGVEITESNYSRQRKGRERVPRIRLFGIVNGRSFVTFVPWSPLRSLTVCLFAAESARDSGNARTVIRVPFRGTNESSRSERRWTNGGGTFVVRFQVDCALAAGS